jgi:dTDP-4-dehydrorhamnose 3,5-epimerase
VKVETTSISGVKIIEPDVYRDGRGYFLETWKEPKYDQEVFETDFCQDNLSYSKHGVLRGLHYQCPNAQAKLVTVLSGEVWDVAVDLRQDEPTFGDWTSVTLSGDNHRQLFLPPWCGHGFVVTGDHARFHYKCSNLYSPDDERSIAWDDPTLGIDWPVEDPILSESDVSAPQLQSIPPEHLF